MSQKIDDAALEEKPTPGFADQLKVLVAVLGAFLILGAVVSWIPKESKEELQKRERAEAELKDTVVIFDARLNKLDAELDQFIVEDKDSKNLDESNERMAKYIKMSEKTQKVLADMLRFFEEFTEDHPNIDEQLLKKLWSPLVAKVESIEKRQNAVHSDVQEGSENAEKEFFNRLKKGQ
ncbi:MAG: hypothetical protein P1V97_19180 [Planctomycetota bacterium]|nr:hypothetical protein [Planctomycetota bacterium]